MPRKRIKDMNCLEAEFRILILKLHRYWGDLKNTIRQLEAERNKGNRAGEARENLKNKINKVELCMSALKLAYRANDLSDESNEEDWQSIEDIVGTTYPRKEK